MTLALALRLMGLLMVVQFGGNAGHLWTQGVASLGLVTIPIDDHLRIADTCLRTSKSCPMLGIDNGSMHLCVDAFGWGSLVDWSILVDWSSLGDWKMRLVHFLIVHCGQFGPRKVV